MTMTDADGTSRILLCASQLPSRLRDGRTEADDGRERLPGRVQQVGMGMMKAIAIVIVRRRL